MSVSTAISNFQVWRERQQARQDHERLETEENQDHPLRPDAASEAGLSRQTSSSSSSSGETPVVETVPEDEDDIENQAAAAPEEPESPTETTPAAVSVPRSRRSRRTTLSIRDLEEERELARRRTSACVLLAVFILFRLWIQAVATADFGLLLLCLVGTSWTARFIRHTREREVELDRLIAEYNDNGDGEAEISRNDIRMMSFQAQLALAIMESQRQMMEGGYGNPDGSPTTPGVSEEAMSHWDRFQFKEAGGGGKEDYGSLMKENGLGKDGDEEPHCSICLGEYEEEEKLVCLPCKHVYHEDCVSSWCSNHVRCPLCNFDLESVAGGALSETEEV